MVFFAASALVNNADGNTMVAGILVAEHHKLPALWTAAPALHNCADVVLWVGKLTVNIASRSVQDLVHALTEFAGCHFPSPH